MKAPNPDKPVGAKCRPRLVERKKLIYHENTKERKHEKDH